MPDPRQHAEDRNLVEKILGYVPGFHGYLEREYRRESDYLARTWLADQLQQCKSGLDAYQARLVEAGRLDELTECEQLRTRLDGLINKVRGTVRGYSGFFDYVKVDEQLLDDVYQLDMSLIKDAEALREAMDELGRGVPSTAEALPPRLEQLDEIDREFNRRGDILKGIGPAH